MSFEIHPTDNGPVIVYNNIFVTINNDDTMIELCYEDGTRFDLIQDHIKDELQNTFDLYIEGFMSGINPPSAKLYAYISAFQQFWIFKNIKFAQFISAMEEAEER